MAEGALSSLRVLDLSLDIPGPYCAGVMACLGAEVLKVEPPAGDPSRRAGPFYQDDPHPEKSGLYLYVNQGKQGVTLNLETRAGRDILLRLAQDADIVVESFPPGYLASLGLAYTDLERVNPRLVLTSVTPFGQDGPYRDWKGTEIVNYALGGQMSQFGDPDREPLKTGGSIAQFFAGMMAFSATMTALFARRITEVGQQVDVSITEAIASMVEGSTSSWQYAGQVNSRTPNQGRSAAEGQYRCADGFVQVSTVVGNNASFQRFQQLMGDPRLGDPRFATPEGRMEHRQEIDALLQPWLSARTKLEIYQQAHALRLPFGYVCTTQDLLESPQFQARGFFVELDHPFTGPVHYPGAPYKMSETPWQARRAPLLGEHNQEVYCGRLGYSREDLARLRATGVI
ncbi:MAG: CoA transferase [Chloroflexi bacterium]|nr:CoA transferase [Chloroflexota bacterium]